MSKIPSDQNGDCSDRVMVERLLPAYCDGSGKAAVLPQSPSNSGDAADEFGEPDILPRIGDEYQAELPAHIGESNCKSYSRHCTDRAAGARPHQNFFIGLPMPLTWIDPKHEVPETVSGSKNNKETGIYSNGETDPLHCSTKPKEESQNLQAEEKIQKCVGEAHVLVPGLVSECWSDAEKASFVLGLYIFEKNFVMLRRFIETKTMGAILSYYYGKFCGSEEYQRWSECRKTKSKKCVYGQRIFSGLRQQELLSRILSRVSEECKSSLSEVSKTFGDEKMSFVDYVFSLKSMVGLKVMVEAVGIGTGKQDLTGMVSEPLRSNQVIPVRPEIPTGKACSALTTTEIVKFLSGDYRLSKARSNDLFWEAVWPRLLARGWHSEQPKNKGHVVGSNHCLVFLVPSVKKFSRKLVKGDHYYDSVTDVLSRVAREPGLIELDDEEADGNKNKQEHEWMSETKSEEEKNDLSTKQRHFYLQPRTPNRSVDAMKFTVVDTSLPGGRVRELRTLPSEISNALISHDHTEGSDQDSLEEKAGECNTMNAIKVEASATDNLRTAKSGGKTLSRRKKQDVNTSYQDNDKVDPDISRTSIPKLKNEKDLNDNKQSQKVSKSQMRRKQRQGNAAPTSKRRWRSTANSHEEEIRDGLSHPTKSSRLENGMSSCCSGIPEFHENLSSYARSFQDKMSSTSSSKGSPSESIGHTLIDEIHATEPSNEDHQTQPLIDLNLPQVPPDLDNSVLARDLEKEEDNPLIKPDDRSSPKSPDVEKTRSQQQSNVIPLRHSTRNRPPTARALEAVANGYLTVNRRQKCRRTSSHEDLAPRPSRRARVVACPNEPKDNSVAPQIGEDANGASTSGNHNTCSKLQVKPDAKEKSASEQ